MNSFIPIVVTPYPDELLYSWVMRLAKINELAIETFFEIYFKEECFSKNKTIPVDIRKGYMNFYNQLNCDIDAMDLYFQLSTLQFELSFYPERQQIKILNNIIRPQSTFSTTIQYFFTKPHVCLECMKEDAEKYGEFYIHRSHQISGVVACHKHHTPLYSVDKCYKRKYIYDFENIITKLGDATEFNCRYADYVHKLLNIDFSSHSNDIMSLIIDEIKLKKENLNLTKQGILNEIEKILRKPCGDRWTKNNYLQLPQEVIPVLLNLFPNPSDFIARLPKHKMVIKNHCDICNKDFYTTKQALKDGWGCIDCDVQLGEQKLLERLIKIIGNNEYELKGFTSQSKKKLLLHHKVCDKDFPTDFAYFIFGNTRCKCTILMSRKEADKKMKKYKHFKLIEFSGSSHPAKFYHDKCGCEFELQFFRDFLETPKCRCCEIQKDVTQEIFEQEVKDIVGDEYTVIGRIKTRDDKIKIKHNTCGCVTEFKASDFLDGSRCPHCYCKASVDKIKSMLREYADDRYTIIGHDKYRIIIFDNETNIELKLRNKRVVQELLRPTPSPILPTHKKNTKIKVLDTWETWYQLCCEYKEEFGHLRIAHTEKYKGKLISDWCTNQRIAYKKGELSEDKVRLLKDIGFVFDIVFYDWYKRFEEYKQYVEETGSKLPKTDEVYRGNKVGTWVNTQRKQRNRGKLPARFEKILLEFNPDFFEPKR